MPLIKRYPNRKLYDTEAKSYVTLENITQMIREGQDVQVVDYESGEDLTNLTFTQIILEQEKKSASGFLPRFLLAGLIRTGGDTLLQMRRSLPSTLVGAGGSDTGEESSLEEEAGSTIERGQQMVEQAQALLKLDDRVAEVLDLLNVPTKRDLQQLQSRIDALSAKLDQSVNLQDGEVEPASSQEETSGAAEDTG